MKVNSQEPRAIELTVDRLNWIIMSIEHSIRYYKKLLKTSKEPEDVKKIYRSIIARDEKELDYLKKVMYQEPEQKVLFE